jgi:hypothetical protein
MPTNESAPQPDARDAPAAEPSPSSGSVLRRPPGVSAFQFVTLCKLRTAQLLRGCRPRIVGVHAAAVTAQREVSEGKVMELASPALPRAGDEPDPSGEAPTRDDHQA